MNLGILIFTLARLVTFSSAMSLFVIVFVVPLLTGLAPRSGRADLSDLLVPSMFQTLLPLVLGFVLVSDNVANSKNLSDGEYLSLLFTRPISRAGYVISKWIAGTIGVAICVFIAYGNFVLGTAMAGQPMIPDWIDAANIILNCMSAVALVVLVSTVPMRLGVFLLVVIFYVSGLGPMFTTFSLKATNAGQTQAATITYAIGTVLAFLQSLLHQTIDLNEVFNSVTFSWTPLITYASNTSLYLLIAIIIMSKREFYYASE